MIAPTAIIAGLGLSLDMDIIDVEGATGDYNTNLMNKASNINAFQNLALNLLIKIMILGFYI